MKKELKAINFKTLRKGSKVFSLRYGNGKVYFKTRNERSVFQIHVQFECVIGTILMSYSFTRDGRTSDSNILPDLYSGHIKGDHTKFKTKIIVYTDEKIATAIQS